MQVLIDIPEESYNYIKIGYVTSDLIRAIKESIVLPKNHSDLIDRDELKKYAGWYNLATDKSIHAVLTSELYQIEPVIPADGGDAE